MEVINNRALKLRLRNPARVTSVIPKSAVVGMKDGLCEVLVNWSLEEAQVLKNLGIKNVPSPIVAKYKWPGMYPPFSHQVQTAAFLTMNRRAFCFNEQGTGKTLSMIWAADYLLNLGLIKRVLVICPVSVMQAAWMNDLFCGVMHRSVSIAHHTDKVKRKKILSVATDFTIINFDGVAIVSKELIAANYDLIIIDEANAVKTATTDRWKHINKLVTPKTWLWMATGTPASQSPTDAYGLLKMMHPTTAPRSFTLFRDMVMTKVTNFKWVPKISAIETVNRLLQPAIRFTKEQCLDLPDIIYSVRDVPLSPAQHKLYEQLRKNQAALAAGQIITAVNAAAGLNKLLQVSSGAVYTDDHLTVELDITPRYNVLKEIIDNTNRKVLVFVPYINTINVLMEKLAKDGYTTDTIHGGIAATKRGAIIKRFETESDPTILVMQPAATAHGTTLVAAATTVWWGPIMSYEIYTQANARFHRQGQKFKCNVIKLQGSRAEILRYKALEVCADNNGSLLALYNDVLTM